MKRNGITFATAVVLMGVVGSSANAGKIEIDGAFGAGVLNSKNLDPTVFGTGATQGVFTTDVLKDLHDDINVNVSTNDTITIVAVDTTDGLALIHLIDDETGSESNQDVRTVAFDSDANLSTPAWINDVGDNIVVTDPTSSTVNANASGTFDWWFNGRGDAFAWADLAVDDSGQSEFTKINADLFTEIQFVTWDSTLGAAGEWTVLGTKDFTGTDVSFSWTVVPTPTAALAGLPILAMLAIGHMRRRRSAA